MKYLKSAFTFLFCLVAWASATHVAVLETGADGVAKEMVPATDRQYLTNVLREEAVKQLPASENYTIMTRENIQQMLPPGKAIEDCEGSCLVETGKNIAADYICQARIGSFAGDLTLSVELYETAGNKLIASFNGHGTNLKELLALIEQKSPDFFMVVKNMETPAPAPEPVPAEPAEPQAQPDAAVAEVASVENSALVEESALAEVAAPAEDTTRVKAAAAYDELDGKSGPQVGESVPANVESEKESHVARWVVLGISVATAVTGAVLAVVGNSQAKDASEKKYSTVSEYERYHDDAESGQTLRTIGIGLAIAGAVGIGISFAF
ncbi:hypothetical protein SAMN05720472_1086 [Fibrobacter sp. UWR3]|uniref:hypothetical protein n=1 Tax=Fibrobacter sp. UWR3 TaxID=1896217 RepID=UPI00091349CA|nr:hypothetical protein [Fibrobacter sp. UWR3]SHM35404.1 hypothetical protein SAMN05720472_1086 [Fibrobacter sp. UWR3]